MRILIACGGTAGHIFPGLALAEVLSKEDEVWPILILVSTHPRDQEYLKAAGAFKDGQIVTVAAAPLPYRFSFQYIPFTLKLIWAHLKSLTIILKYKPEVVVGFGGYSSFAPVIIAHLLGIPTLIHEQNLRPGRANQLLARVVDRIAVTFEDTNKFLGRKVQRKIVRTGFPLRRGILRNSTEKVKTLPEKFTILVIGGSQGAHNINELILSCLSLMQEEQLGDLQLIHLAGKRDLQYVKARYQALSVSFWVFDFLEDMEEAYSKADLVVSRSGAGTIFELASFGLPCILVPHSFGTRHQQENALYLRRFGAAIVLDEKTQTAEDFKKVLLELIDNRKMRENLAQSIKRLEVPQACQKLKTQINALCRGR